MSGSEYPAGSPSGGKGGPSAPTGVIASIVRAFLQARLSILFMAFALAVGAGAIMLTPREEEPQIVVPMADVMVNVPGASAEEVEKLVATPLERLLWQLDGVEYVYSTSYRDHCMVTVRFYVGENREDSLVKLHNTIMRNVDLAPAVVSGWVVKPVEIDDVPIVTMALHSKVYDDFALRRMAEEMFHRLASIPDVSRVSLAGGRGREVRVELEPQRLRGFNVSPLEVSRALAGADVSRSAGKFSRANRELSVTANSFFLSASEVGDLVVGVFDGRPVYLRDVAEVRDGPQEPKSYTRIRFPGQGEQPAVTLALSKKKGTNAVKVAADVIAEARALQHDVLPDGVELTVTRNYGQTAQDKVNNLLSSLGFAIITVVALLAFTLGWREAFIVALAVPVSFALALGVNYLLGYTINRVTLFALILSLGLVVDDPITNVDNIQRHILMRKQGPRAATLTAVDEVLPPVIMSTLAIIVSFLPLFFISGMMGPYMAPMAANVPLTVTFSTVCALTIVPWMAYNLLKRLGRKDGGAGDGSDTGEPTETKSHARIRRVYEAVVAPFLERRGLRWALLGGIVLLLVGSLSLAALRMVPLKMLPFDNKNEFQIVIDMDEGTTLEATDRVVRDFEEYLQSVPEVVNVTTYSGIASPMDFNGMVRHYYMREGSNVADIRVNLLDKSERDMQSHAILLRLRTDLQNIAARHKARIKLVEVPPGPPVISTLTAEIYGPSDKPYASLVSGAEKVADLMRVEPGVVDVDTSAEASRPRMDFVLDKEKAALHGVSARDAADTLALALGGEVPATVHEPHERQPLDIRLILPESRRSSYLGLAETQVRSAQSDGGELVPLAELGSVVRVPEDQPIYHKNLRRVAYAFAETAGIPPAEAVIDLGSRLAKDPLPDGLSVDWAGEGEWKITVDVFRDLGIAFGVALLGIYVLLVLQTNSFFMPVLIMSAIPLTLLGILPGFWLLNMVAGDVVGGFGDPVFFTATSMIGMIALGGIVIRNSVVLIEFIQDAQKQGLGLREAVLQSGAIRLRPIVLTALTTALGAWPITLDPIFSGLAWALIFGLFASTLFTLVVIPVAYYAVYRNKPVQGGNAGGESPEAA
ncbi:MAG: efflux RND transporter permease subunit [Desulfovibrio sp.]|uniref:efflux RND transporter permease subunit n=1 Tax=Desulfovibrio sp. 7SRBS1 TaxID=3378064 RepID=UPI003B3F007F